MHLVKSTVTTAKAPGISVTIETPVFRVDSLDNYVQDVKAYAESRGVSALRVLGLDTNNGSTCGTRLEDAVRNLIIDCQQDDNGNPVASPVTPTAEEVLAAELNRLNGRQGTGRKPKDPIKAARKVKALEMANNHLASEQGKAQLLASGLPEDIFRKAVAASALAMLEKDNWQPAS